MAVKHPLEYLDSGYLGFTKIFLQSPPNPNFTDKIVFELGGVRSSAQLTCLGKRLEYAESTKEKYRSTMKPRLVPGVEIRVPFGARPSSSRQPGTPAKRLTSEEKHISQRVSRTGRERSDPHGPSGTS
ncbi:hypothetical protein ALC56_04360 [Trachymyrmex septentrionalis]|uniref:Uncharacterized protein n=1 Tax=Trachymyrmex septentrionalis TaxID=34720 RepID=A0A195FMP1_9HYME|nr:hypothetical protein ALC56_04360 [Trachymyrmex septentrionalis]